MDRDKKISCVILNYNDAAATERLVRQIFRYPALDAVVVVDNCSTDDSGSRLQAMAADLDPDEIGVLKSSKHGGDGTGAAQGVRQS